MLSGKASRALEGGVDGLSVSSGMAAIEYALINIAESGNTLFSAAAVRRYLYAARTYLPEAGNHWSLFRRATGPKTWRS